MWRAQRWDSGDLGSIPASAITWLGESCLSFPSQPGFAQFQHLLLSSLKCPAELPSHWSP